MKKTLDRLTAEHFLIKPIGCESVWHIDRDINNNYYKNTMLANCKKKHVNRSKWSEPKENLPLGVRYNDSMKKYYGEIKLCGTNNVIKLSYWDTPEEAFEEYQKIKQADVLLMAAKYKNKVRKHIYDALLKVKVKAY
ncbi:hypothetical protein [Lacrimispora sp.]|uniref:hypothetical protein n=1 Tax=Lacrimispora sp. TaxID=2719234 RepID=UPI0028ABB0E8|nr:hypothetical protein [Lacrimispora sp.]